MENPLVLKTRQTAGVSLSGSLRQLDLELPVVDQERALDSVAAGHQGERTGRRDKVIPMARAGMAAGANGLLIEVHCDPDEAWSDGALEGQRGNGVRAVSNVKPVAGSSATPLPASAP